MPHIYLSNDVMLSNTAVTECFEALWLVCGMNIFTLRNFSYSNSSGKFTFMAILLRKPVRNILLKLANLLKANKT